MQIEVPHDRQMFVNARALIYRIQNDHIELVVQTRNREGQKAVTEFPGGTVETFEPLLEALKREVKEETGLELSVIEGQSTRLEQNINSITAECLSPYAIYQTTAGFNGMGAFFRCQATGTLCAEGDGSTQVRWERLGTLLDKQVTNPDQFSITANLLLTKIRNEGPELFPLTH